MRSILLNSQIFLFVLAHRHGTHVKKFAGKSVNDLPYHVPSNEGVPQG